MFTILPPPARFMCGYAACEATKALVRFVSSTSFHSSSEYSSGRLRTLMPALLTRISRRPSRFAASSTIARQLASSFRSASSATAPGRLCSAAAFLALSRPAIATLAPAAASPCAMARPMPPLPPVTSAVLPLRSKRSMRHYVILAKSKHEPHRHRTPFQPFLYPPHWRARGALSRQPVSAAAGARALRAWPARRRDRERARRGARSGSRLPEPPRAEPAAAGPAAGRALEGGRAARAAFAERERPQGLPAARCPLAPRGGRHAGSVTPAAAAAPRGRSASGGSGSRTQREPGFAARASPRRHRLGGACARAFLCRGVRLGRALRGARRRDRRRLRPKLRSQARALLDRRNGRRAGRLGVRGEGHEDDGEAAPFDRRPQGARAWARQTPRGGVHRLRAREGLSSARALDAVQLGGGARDLPGRWVPQGEGREARELRCEAHGRVLGARALAARALRRDERCGGDFGGLGPEAAIGALPHR